MLSEFVNNGWRGFPCAKSSLTPELYDLWKQKVGQSINSEFDYGLNLQGAVALQSKKNGLVLPVFKEDLSNPACYLPHTYQPQIHVESITHDNQESFIEKALLPAIRQIHPHTASYKNYASLVGGPGSGYEKGMNPKVYWKQVWQDNDYNRYKVVETFLLPQLQQLFPESEVYKNYANFVNIKGTDKINPASGYKVGEDLDGYYQRVWANHPDPNVRAKAKNLIGETFDPLNIKDIESLNFSNRTNHHEQLGEALIRGFGKGIDKLLCNTIGFCDANAGAGKIALEVVKHGPQIINWADKSWKSISTVVGLSASTMYNNKQKNLVTEIIDWLNKPIVEIFPASKDEKIKLLVTEGIVGEPKVETFPANDGSGKVLVDIKTPILDDGLMKQRLIHMEVTQEDIDFGNSAGLQGPTAIKKGTGLKWKDKHGGNSIRIRVGDPTAPHESQKVDYVQIRRGGKVIGPDQKELKPTKEFPNPKNNPHAHINK